MPILYEIFGRQHQPMHWPSERSFGSCLSSPPPLLILRLTIVDSLVCSIALAICRHVGHGNLFLVIHVRWCLRDPERQTNSGANQYDPNLHEHIHAQVDGVTPRNRTEISNTTKCRDERVDETNENQRNGDGDRDQ